MTRRAFAALTAPAVLLLAMFFALPLAGVLSDAFSGGGTAFARVLALDAFWPSVAGSLALTAVAAVLSTVAGFAVALHLSRLHEGRRTLLSFLIALPLTFSGLIVAYGFILAYGRAGFFTQLIGMFGADTAEVGRVLFTPVGLAFASSYYLIPRVVMLLLPVLVNFDGNQIEVAESLGATRLQALREILLPQIAGAVIAALCLVAAVVLGAYGTALALVGTQLRILPLQLYSLVSETGSDFPAAAALALLITAACSSVMAAGEWISRSHERHLTA